MGGQDSQQGAPTETRELVVTAATEKASGEKNGKRWTIYEIHATTPDGRPVDVKLRAWEALPVGEPRTYQVRREDSDEWGTQFWLSLPRGKLGPRVGMLEQQVTELAERVAQLEAQVLRTAA